MLYLGIDPGPVVCGVCWYDDSSRTAHDASTLPVAAVLGIAAASRGLGHVVAIERVRAQGVAGASVISTAEVVGRLWQACGSPLLLYRSDVLRALDVTGRGNRDSMVRERLMQMHGGSKEVAVGAKKAPGPLYGVTGHAWQALAVAVAASMGAGEASL